MRILSKFQKQLKLYMELEILLVMQISLLKKKYMFLLKAIMKLPKFQLRMMEMDILKIFLVKLVSPILNLHLIKTIINQV